MSVWDVYNNRCDVRGQTKRDASLKRELWSINNKMSDSLSFHTVAIDENKRDVVILNSDNLNEKTIISMPGEYIPSGSLVNWEDNWWLVTECDANREIYSKAKMLQCNHLLHWIDNNGTIHERWCIIEDGTKYLTGELEDNHFIVTRGDSRIAMTITRNEYTSQFRRDNRFLIDDPLSPHKLAYALTKPLKIGTTFNDEGIYKFVLQEVSATEYDNHELGVADYYKYFTKESSDHSKQATIDPKNNKTDDGREVWL